MDACRPNTQAGGPTQPGRDELGPLLPIPAKYSLKKWNEKSIEKDLKISSENAEFDYLYIICYNIVGVLIFTPSVLSRISSLLDLMLHYLLLVFYIKYRAKKH